MLEWCRACNLVEDYIGWSIGSKPNRAVLEPGSLHFRLPRSTKGNSQDESQGDLGHSMSLASYRPTGRKGNTSEKPRDKASRYT